MVNGGVWRLVAGVETGAVTEAPVSVVEESTDEIVDVSALAVDDGCNPPVDEPMSTEDEAVELFVESPPASVAPVAAMRA